MNKKYILKSTPNNIFYDVWFIIYMCPLPYFQKVQINQLKRQIIFETEKEDDDPSFIQKLQKQILSNNNSAYYNCRYHLLYQGAIIAIIILICFADKIYYKLRIELYNNVICLNNEQVCILISIFKIQNSVDWILIEI